MAETRREVPCHLMFSSSITSRGYHHWIPSEGMKAVGQRGHPLVQHHHSCSPSPGNKETEQPWQKSHRQNPPACRLLKTIRLKGGLTSHLPQCLLSRGVWHQRSPEKEASCLGTMPMFKSVHCHGTQYSGAEARMETELVCVCVPSLWRTAETHSAVLGSYFDLWKTVC